MKSLTLKSSVNEIKGIGPKASTALKHNHILRIIDLLGYYPYRFDDYTIFRKTSQINIGEYCHIIVTINSIKSSWAPRRRISVVSAIGQDETGQVKIVWFNNKYIARYLKKGEKYVFLGKAVLDQNGFYFSNPIIFHEEKKDKIQYLFPVYSEMLGLKSKWFSDKIGKILFLAKKIKDPLPEEIVNRQKLIGLNEAIKYIHSPRNPKQIDRARLRLGFEEIFYLQLRSIHQREKHSRLQANAVSKNIVFVKKQLDKLPFSLTNHQKKALWEIMNDINKPYPMNRLLEGDVGSGKTIVAALAMSITANDNYQSFLIAPTEILAIQHFHKIREYLHHNNYTIGLFTANQMKIVHSGKIKNIGKSKLLQDISNNKINILISTHAILHAKIGFKKLNLVVVDEQHRFGVRQRNFFYSKNSKYVPHHLSMSATPIPRSLALTIYGHLSLSQLKTLPSGRQPVKTTIINPDQREQCYQFIRRQIQAGRQVFVICPLIEESSKIQVKSAKKEYHRLQKYVFPDIRLGLVHGQLNGEEKEDVFRQFQQGKLKILISTSVIEVGIDIPNANIIIIEGSERFGLSQLHQLRGRVGRGKHQSYCFLFTENANENTIQRLQVLISTNDGFQIAEADLKLRGPGELGGFRQSGIPDLKMASLSDQKLIRESYKEAERILIKDPELKKYPLLHKKINIDETIIS